MIEIPIFNVGQGEPNKVDFSKVFNETFVDIDAVIEKPPIALSIGEHEYKGKWYPTPFGSYGDFSCIVGASKSKKTFLKSLFMACYITGETTNRYAPHIKGHNTLDKYVFDIDTEQSVFHCQRVFRRVVEIVGRSPEIYKPFSLRSLPVKERLQFIEWLYLDSEYRGKIGFSSIDGVADLVSNVNDEEQSYAVAQKLLEWSQKSGSHIVTVMHKNFQSGKPTGHLGSAVLKKAETVVFVEPDEGYMGVKPEYTRNIPFEPFKFDIDLSHLPYVVQDGSTRMVIRQQSEKNDIPF